MTSTARDTLRRKLDSRQAPSLTASPPAGLRALAEVALALLGSVILGSYVPWSLVFLDTIPSGGDNPSHPVLMQMVGDALFRHGHIVHYNYAFWGGFEAFQFYFPLPYVVGATLALVIPPNVAFKLITLFGILALPPAFYWMARALRMPLVVRALAGLLAIPFLFTEAHVMWGGNIFSALAGMIGNQWGFVFFVAAFGMILAARREGRFSGGAVALSVLAAMSHFYALLMLLFIFAAFLLIDGARGLADRRVPSLAFPTYAIGVSAVLLMAWWILPLAFYTPYTSDLGGGWTVSLPDTLTTPEMVGFGVGLLVCAADVGWRVPRIPARTTLLVFLGLYLTLFTLNDRFEMTVFMDPRIWPTIYFGGYALVVFALDSIAQRLPPPVVALVAAPLWLWMPSDTAFSKAGAWMTWNYRGVEQAPGWGDFRRVIDILRAEPPGRVAYESSDAANAILGSVRTPELLPLLTAHDIMLGGIVNSASYPGIGYLHQCLMSFQCAGWPPGSIMPERDIPRAITRMRALGIRYHVALRSETRDLFARAPEVEVLHLGTFASLFRLRVPPDTVEVYDAPLPTFCSRRFASTLLNLLRLDSGADVGIRFARDCASIDPAHRVDPSAFFNFYLSEWNAGRRTLDRGWAERVDRIQNRLNGLILSLRRPFDAEEALHGGMMEFFVADRPFDRDLYLAWDQEGYSEVAAPLLRTTPGQSEIRLEGRGYRAYAGTQEIAFGKPAPLQFDGPEAFRWLVFKPIPGERYRDFQMSTPDPLLRSGLPGPTTIPFPRRITADCRPRIERTFHRVTLHTDCIGKPHLVKLMHYPKWHSTVDVELGTNGFMVITPTAATTVLKHRRTMPDWAGLLLTTATAVVIPVARRRYRRSRSSSTSRHANAFGHGGTTA